MRRLAVFLSTLLVTLAMPAAALAAGQASDKPAGVDHTLTTIFFVALGIPLVLTILTLIDMAVGRHHNGDH